MDKIPTMTVVAAALVRSDGCILLQQRAHGKAMAGLWEFPGGKVEAGERPEEALARELDEELGILVEPADLSPALFASADNGGRHMLLLLYLCRSWRGAPAALDAAALRWAHPRDMHELPMPPADEPLVAMLEALL
jgi:8-oxo-dGTP diphosphatase